MSMNPLGRALLGLHTWGGLIFGWLLIPIFIAGSLAVFEPEISRWLAPGLTAPAIVQSSPRQATIQAVELAEQRLQAIAPQAARWQISLPTSRAPHLAIAWNAQEQEPAKEEILDATNGTLLRQGTAEGGHFYTEFHAMLHSGSAGKWLVGSAGIVMLAALISGLLIHTRWQRDFFSFRLWAGRRRAWLDAHNLIGLAILPFLLMISWTGVVILAETFMPAATLMLYDGKPRANRAEVVHSFKRPPAGLPADMRPLTSHLAAAERLLGTGTISTLIVHHPNDRHGLVQAMRHVDDRLAAVADHVTFDAASGVLFGQQVRWNPLAYTYRAQVGLHVAHYGGPLLRWLYFIFGLLTAALMAAGIVLFNRKQRQKSRHAACQYLIETVSLTAVGGSTLACLAYLWSARLTAWPALHLPDHAPIVSFYLVWALTTVHAAWRTHGHTERAWREQLTAAALFCLFLPLLDLAGQIATATSSNLPTLAATPMLALGFALTAGSLGILLFCSRRLFQQT
jgi:uncharacterized iron-regulated membrane protein